MEKVISFAHQLIQQIVSLQDNTLDLTIGNGNDTLFLASISGHVYGFDIQEKAIENTKEKVKGFHNVTLFLDGHEHLDRYELKNIQAIMMNLGYLPMGDKSITTVEETTLQALSKGLNILNVGGIFAIVLYPGHTAGFMEAKKVEKYCQQLNQKEYQVLKYEFINQIHYPPYLIAIQKIRSVKK